MILPALASVFIVPDIEAILASDPKRPAGTMDVMHHGSYLRNRLGYSSGVNIHWWHLNRVIEELSDTDLAPLQALFDQRAWTIGRLSLHKLAERLWQNAPRSTRGYYLAGRSSDLRPTDSQLAAWMFDHLPECDFDAPAAAELGVNAVRYHQFDLLRALLDREDIPDEPVPRLTGCVEQERFESEIGQLSHRFLDILLETAVRCRNSEAAKLVLERGANPNIPCWNLERGSNEWYSALSMAITGRREMENPNNLLIDALLEGGTDPRGCVSEGLNKPLFLALQSGDWELADRLLALGASFTGGEIPVLFVPVGDDQRPSFGFYEVEEWVKNSPLPSLLHLPQVPQVPYFYSGNAQGGSHITFLQCLLHDSRLPQLQYYEQQGLSALLSVPDLAYIIHYGSYEVLSYLMRDHPRLPETIHQIRRYKPDFGIQNPMNGNSILND